MAEEQENMWTFNFYGSLTLHSAYLGRSRKIMNVNLQYLDIIFSLLYYLH